MPAAGDPDARAPAARETSPPLVAPGEADVYRALFERAVNGTAYHRIVLDAEGRPVDYVFLRVNEAFERLTGLSRAKVLGRRVTEVLPGIERDPADWIGRYGRVALHGEPLRFQQFSATLQRWYDVAAFSPATGFFAVVFSDVTDHERLARALRESERRYRLRSSELEAVLNATHAQLALLDPELRFVMVNDAYERGCGHPRAALVGRAHFELFPNEENERIFRRVLRTGEPFFAEEKPFEYADRPEHGVTWWNWSLVPVRGDGDEVEGVLLSLLDVTGQVLARKAVEELAAERQRSAEALRAVDRRRTDFLAALSHELRNPLAPVRTAVWLLGRPPPERPEARRAVDILDRQIAHLGRIVDDLLDVTRISRGKIVLRTARLDVVDLVRRAVEDHRAPLAALGVSVAERYPDGPAWVEADATRIAQALGNLLQNAGKFGAEGGGVEVAVEPEPARTVAIRVRDSGPGIAPEMLERIFEPFTQGEDGLARSRGGLGLGLSLVKGLVELHGGSVEARSEGPGRGAELVVRLPTSGPPLADPAPAERRTDPATGRARRRVLVIEDNADAAETLRDVLLLWDHEVMVASDGREGLEKARRFRPDVVLCDIGLPVMDGYAVARALRADPDPAVASVKLVAVTGYAAPEDRQRAAEAGFDRHLGKPVPLELIEEAVGEPIRR